MQAILTGKELVDILAGFVEEKCDLDNPELYLETPAGKVALTEVKLVAERKL